MDNQLDLNSVRAFVAVVDARGFRGAAQALAVPRSTLSRKLAELEARLGSTLLKRTTRKLSLTEAGEDFYRQVSPALATLGDAERALVDAQSSPRGTLRITCTHNFAEMALGPVLERYLRDNPEVRVFVDLSDRFVDLVGEGFDVAIRGGELPDSTLIARPLGPAATFGCYATPKYLKAHGTPKKLRDLEGHHCIVYSPTDRHSKWTFIGPGKKRVSVSVKARLTVNSFLLVHDHGLAGFGVARMPEPFARPSVAKGLLVPLLEEFALPPQPIHIVYPPNRYLAPRVRAFVDLLLAQKDLFPDVGFRRRARQ